jgi:hypothetical protein
MRYLRTHLIKIAVYVILTLLVIVPFLPMRDLTQAAASNIIFTPSVQMAFPNTITFKVQAQSNAVITQLRLHYIVNRQNFAQVTSESWPVYTPDTSVNTQWVWDMRKSAIPVGTKVNYWWTARDAAGNDAESNHAAIEFDDSQRQWQSIADGPITLLWYSGNTAFANALMAAAQQGLQRIENDIGVVPQGSVRIYIYASVQDLLAAQLFAPDWEGGVTFQGFDVIAIGVATNQLSYGIDVTPHELTHWATGHLVFNSYGAGLPTWLEEGLATYVQDEQDSNWLNLAIKQNKLISVRTLSSPFSAVAEQAYISYAESHSIVSFLLATYGKDKMVQLLNVFRDGSTYDSALQQVYGFDQDGLNQLWQKSIGVNVSSAPLPSIPVVLASALNN